MITHDRQNGTPAAGQWRVRAMDQYGGSTLPPGGRAAPVACTLAAATPVVLGQRPARWNSDETQPVSAVHRDPVEDVPPASVVHRTTCCPHVEALVLHHEGQHKEQPRCAKEMCSQKMAVPLSQPPPRRATAATAPGKSTQIKHPEEKAPTPPAPPPPACPQSALGHPGAEHAHKAYKAQ